MLFNLGIEKLRHSLGRPSRSDFVQFVFVGDEFGYTGTTSPLLAYARAVENRELEIGDNVVFGL